MKDFGLEVKTKEAFACLYNISKKHRLIHFFYVSPREGMPPFSIDLLIISRFLLQVRNVHDLDCRTSASLSVVLYRKKITVEPVWSGT